MTKSEIAEQLRKSIINRIAEHNHNLENDEILLYLKREIKEMEDKSARADGIVFNDLADLIQAGLFPEQVSEIMPDRYYGRVQKYSLLYFKVDGEEVEIAHKCDDCGGYVLGQPITKHLDVDGDGRKDGETYHCRRCDNKIGEYFWKTC